MDKITIQKLKKELLTKKSHDIFKNVEVIFDLAYSTGDMDLCFKCREICAQKSKNLKMQDLSTLNSTGSYIRRQ